MDGIHLLRTYKQIRATLSACSALVLGIKVHLFDSRGHHTYMQSQVLDQVHVFPVYAIMYRKCDCFKSAPYVASREHNCTTCFSSAGSQYSMVNTSVGFSRFS